MLPPLTVVFNQLFELGWPPGIALSSLQGMARGCGRELDFCSLADTSYAIEVLAPQRAVEVLLQAGLWHGFASKRSMDVEQFLLWLLSILN